MVSHSVAVFLSRSRPKPNLYFFQFLPKLEYRKNREDRTLTRFRILFVRFLREKDPLYSKPELPRGRAQMPNRNSSMFELGHPTQKPIYLKISKILTKINEILDKRLIKIDFLDIFERFYGYFLHFFLDIL